MCGLAGVLHPAAEQADPADLQAMAAAVAHRGPDALGFFTDGPLGFAHRRLAILDLSDAGRQPMANEDGSVVAIYNGQLYRFQAVRDRLEAKGHRFRSRADTEILVHLYEEEGEGLVESIDGMFAFALWDAGRRRLLLARDRLGIKPLYYVQHAGRLAFASELRALLALPWLPRDIDDTALVQYLYQSSVPGTSCIVRGVRKLGPGERLVAEEGGIRVERYWQPPTDTLESIGLDGAAGELRERLGDSVRSHLVADVPVGAFLSGGLDSTAVTAEAVRAGALQTFSVRFREDDEGPAAAETARALGTTHHELFVEPESLQDLTGFVALTDEPFAVSSALAIHPLARFARERVKVALTGDGADELLGGYPWRHEPSRGLAGLRSLALLALRSRRGAAAGGPSLAAGFASRASRLLRDPAAHYAQIVAAFTPEELASLIQPDRLALIHDAWKTLPLHSAYRDASGGDPVNQRLRTDLATTLGDEMLTKVDRMTMAAGLEARVPFLDRPFVEWALRLPGRLKVRNGRGKLVLRHALAGRLPQVAARPKHGFNVPLGAWFRGPLRSLVADVLSPESLARRGWFRGDAVGRLLGAHQAGSADYSRKIFTLLVLELWLRRHRAA